MLKNKPKKVLVICGQMGSGKDTVCRIISDVTRVESFSFSTPLKDLLNRLYLSINRENLQNVSTALRECFSQDLLSQVLTQDIKNSKFALILLNGARRVDDLDHIRKEFDTKIIYIDAKPKIRYGRITQRREKVDDAKKTYKEFLKDSKREADLKVHELKNIADHVIQNNSTIHDLKKQVENLLFNVIKVN